MSTGIWIRRYSATDPDAELDDEDLDWVHAPPPAASDEPTASDEPAAPPRTPQPPALAKIGRAVLRLRLFWRWTQLDVERASGVDQTTISRFERGEEAGLSTARLAAILDALRVGDVTFDKPPTVPQTELERMIHGDPWQRARIEADRRLGWPGSGREPPKRRKRAPRNRGLRYRQEP